MKAAFTTNYNIHLRTFRLINWIYFGRQRCDKLPGFIESELAISLCNSSPFKRLTVASYGLIYLRTAFFAFGWRLFLCTFLLSFVLIYVCLFFFFLFFLFFFLRPLLFCLSTGRQVIQAWEHSLLEFVAERPRRGGACRLSELFEEARRPRGSQLDTGRHDITIALIGQYYRSLNWGSEVSNQSYLIKKRYCFEIEFKWWIFKSKLNFL